MVAEHSFFSYYISKISFQKFYSKYFFATLKFELSEIFLKTNKYLIPY